MGSLKTRHHPQRHSMMMMRNANKTGGDSTILSRMTAERCRTFLIGLGLGFVLAQQLAMTDQVHQYYSVFQQATTAGDGSSAIHDALALLPTSSSSSSSSSSASKSSSSSFELAKHQSLGFMDDIPEQEWLLMKQKVHQVYPNTNGNPYSTAGRKAQSQVFYQSHYEPDFNCRFERRVGKLGDGGKWICDPHRLALPTAASSLALSSSSTSSSSSTTSSTPPPACLVYSIGSNGDPTFEQGIVRDIGPHCEIHTFDMDAYGDIVQKAVPHAHYHQWGITSPAKASDQPQGRKGHIYKTLNQTIHELGHAGRPIDIFKIDCEGCEWDIYEQFFWPGIDLRQVLIELHGSHDRSKFSGVRNMDGLQVQYRQVVLPQTPDFFKAMQQRYVIFHKEPNIQWSVGASAIEYCFLKLHEDFFSGIGDDKK